MAVGAPRRDARGALIGHIGSIIDLHDRMTNERELAETRLRLEAVMNAAPIGLCYTDGPNCDHVIGNNALLAQFEWLPSSEISASAQDPEAAGRQVRYVKDGRRLEEAELPLQRSLHEKRAIEREELEISLPSGRKWSLEASAAPVFSDEGRLLGSVAVTVDVTERKKNLEALQASEQRFRSLVETSRDGIVTVDISGRILDANAAYQQMLGYTLEELRRLTYQELTPEIWHEMEAEIVRDHTLARGESPEYEKQYIRKDGSHFPVSLRSWTVVDEDGRIVAMRAFVRDISERRISEAAMRNSELRHRTLVRAASAITWCCPSSGLHVEPQPEWMAFTGQTAEEMLGDGWTRAVHPDDQPAATAKWQEAVKHGGLFESEHRIRRHDGAWRWMSVQAAPVRDANDEVVEWFGMNIDITRQREAEEALRDRNRQLKLLARTSQLLLLESAKEKELLETIFSDIADDIGVEWYYHFQPIEPRVLGLAICRGVCEEDQRFFATMRFGEALCGRVAETQTRLVIEDLQHSREPGAEFLNAAGAKSYAGFPLVADRKLFGTIAFVSRERTHFRDGDMQVIQSICDQIAIVFERMQTELALRESQRQLAMALEAGQLGFWDWDVSSGRAQFGGHWASMLGYELDTIETHYRTWKRSFIRTRNRPSQPY